MIKTKFVFAVSLVAMLAVSSAWAYDPADTSSTTDTVATEHKVYTDQTPTTGAGIAGVSYVNKAVNKAGASAQAAEAHAAAAGASALAAAESAADAASSAKSANDALLNKQPKSTADYQMGNKSGGWTTLSTKQKNALDSGVTSTTKVTRPASTAVGSETLPVYVNSNGVVTAITSYEGTAAKATADASGNNIENTYATKAQFDSLGDKHSELVNSVNELKTGKQDALTAGANITIADDGTISAKDTVYTLPTASATTLGGVKVDTALSSTSTNPVQNKVINTALANKQDKSTAVKVTTSGTAVGSATVPVYVNSDGVATAITSYGGNAASATKATQDGNGKVIADTYATKTALSDGLATKQATLTTSNIKGSGSVTVGISNGVITVSGTDNNTTYSTGTATSSGLTKLYTGAGTNTDGTMTQAALNTALGNKLDKTANAASATKATQDGNGKVIADTYATKTELSDGLATKQATLTTSNIKGSGSVTVGISNGVITVSGTDNNTTYSTGTATSSGLTKLYTGTGTNTDGTMTQAALNTALGNKLDKTANAASATKATQDGNGKVIADTYATKTELSDGLATKQATLTTSNIKGSGSVTVGISNGVITVSGTDNNTTYSTGTATSSGLTKLYTGTGTNTDGTMTQAALNTALANKQDKSTTVTHTANTAVGSETLPVYVNSDGVATAITSYGGNAASATKATQDGNGKVIADTYATKAQFESLGNKQSELVNSVNELTTGKQDALTETGSANRPVYAVAGGVAAVTGMSIPYGKEFEPTSWATIWVE